MWIVPFLHVTHEYPLTTFDQEWWTAILGLSAMLVMLGKAFWQSPQVPRIMLLPLALILVAFVQLASGKIAYFQQGWLYVLYLLFAALLMALGAWLRREIGIDKLSLGLALFLVVGAAISAAIGVLQHFGWHTWFDSFVVRKISPSLYGNVAQPNHYANYIALGLISVGLLYQQQKLKLAYVVALVALMLFVMTLSGSRSSWFYLFAMTALAALGSYQNRALRPLLKYSVALIVGFVLMHFMVQLPILAGADAETNTFLRLINSDTNSNIRLYLWREAITIFLQSPWLGVGFGQFAFHHFELVPALQPKNIVGLYNNAHNVIFQLAAETGLAGLAVLFTTVGAWFYGLRRVTITAGYWWGYAVLSVAAIHSLLEYPLWYSYFMAILAVVWGIFDETHFRLEFPKAGRIFLLMTLLMGWLTMLQLQFDYLSLKATISPPTTVRLSPEELSRRTLDGLNNSRKSLLLSPYADLFLSSFTEVSPQSIKEKIAFNDLVMHYIPTAEVTYRSAMLLAQDGQLDAAKILLEQAIWSYPADARSHGLLMSLQENDPQHFSVLLDFANQKEQEHTRAILN
jgi:O-antigen ligase